MRPQKRGDEPAILTSMGKVWAAKFEARRNKKGGAPFYWPAMPLAERTNRKERLNHRLLPLLSAQTEGCCSFCDKRPVETASIEHYKPKSVYHTEAYKWRNLFYCCGKCQSRKLEKWHALLLKPDETGYRFEDYFQWNFQKGALEPNAAAAPERRRAAQLTICLYNLNDPDHCRSRLHERKNRRARPEEPLEDFNYPGFLTADELPPAAGDQAG